MEIPIQGVLQRAFSDNLAQIVDLRCLLTDKKNKSCLSYEVYAG